MVSFSTPCSIFALPSRSWIWGLAASLRWIDEIRKPPPLLLFSVSFSPYYKNTPSSPKTLDRVPLHSLGLHFGPVPAPHLQLPVQRRRRPSSDAPRGGAPIATPAIRLFLSLASPSPSVAPSLTLVGSSRKSSTAPPPPDRNPLRCRIPLPQEPCLLLRQLRRPPRCRPRPLPPWASFPPAGPPFSASPYSSLISCSHLFHQIGP